MTGMLSPVSMASLTMHDPVKRQMSQGIEQFSGISITSPGTSSLLSISSN